MIHRRRSSARRIARSTIVAIGCASVSAAAPLGAQADGLVAYPDTYRVQFENPWVRLVRVRLAGGANLGMHTHPAGFMFHVYLNDADPIVFEHDGSPGEVHRPPVTARSYRIGRATPESHAVINPSSRSSDYLRVEYKTQGNEATRRRMRAPPLGAETAAVVEHTGEQSRATRVTIAPNASHDVVAPAGEPTLLLFVTDATIAGESGSATQAIKAGAERFVEAGRRATIRNAGTAPLQLLRFDFLTSPAR